LDEEHTKRPVLVVAGTEDKLGSDIPNWLVANYNNSRLKWVKGGHIAPVYTMDELWEELLYDGEGLSKS
jgi:hypothetical protein